MTDVLVRFGKNPIGIAAAIFIVALLLLTLVAPALVSIDPKSLSDEVLAAPSMAHFLGTDELGRDVAMSLIYGIRVSLFVGIVAAFGTLVLGVLVGAWAGFYGGRIDLTLMRVAEMFQVLPSFVLAAAIVAMLGPGITRVVFIIALLSWPQVALVMRSEILRIKHLDFVDAVRCLGYRESYIMLYEVVPNALRSVIALTTLIVGEAILIEAALSFLGLSSPDQISWGRMLNSGQRFLFDAWWLSVVPGIAIFLTVLAFNVLGDAISAAMNPKDVE